MNKFQTFFTKQTWVYLVVKIRFIKIRSTGYIVQYNQLIFPLQMEPIIVKLNSKGLSMTEKWINFNAMSTCLGSFYAKK